MIGIVYVASNDGGQDGDGTFMQPSHFASG